FHVVIDHSLNRHNNLHDSLSNRLNASVRTQTKRWNSAFWNAAFQKLEYARSWNGKDLRANPQRRTPLTPA
ncbi:hypothetical protein, partial [Paraburkholderia aromaticivorans]|uniref:hypothetical protein n=1 Tax=Paraburkholderia aromaticivorans TaxID=2026199 RepID=UPI0038BA98D1